MTDGSKGRIIMQSVSMLECRVCSNLTEEKSRWKIYAL